ELLNECRSPRRWLAHFAPYLLDFRERHILSRYVTVQDGLIERIAGLEHDVVHFFRKSRVADQRENEVIQILHSVALRHGHDFILVEGREDGAHSPLWRRVRGSRRTGCLRWAIR